MSAVAEREVFEKAIDIGSDDERSLFLDTACGEDRALRARVDSLLEAYYETGFLTAEPESSVLPLVAMENASEGLLPDDPVQVGPYRIVRRVGTGGFGTVYEAEQTGPLKRRVALKMIKLGMDTEQIIRRFEAERQVLALMEHPGIARVYDAGTSESGRPYFAMEFVDGVPITNYCDDHRLDVEARLKLFAKVCKGIQHAHQKGVIHRDIKPSNVLITEEDGQPLPKVIDFGIARAMESVPGETLLTLNDQFVGSPAYVSPEHALGSEGVDTRSDIYSLGILLQELLIGCTPLDTSKVTPANLDEFRSMLREFDPPRPSVRYESFDSDTAERTASVRDTTHQGLAEKIRGDLDAIVLKALAREPGDRYETAGGIGADIQNHLEARPILATEPSALYLAQRYAKRHRRTLMVASAMILLLAVGAAVSLVLAYKASEANKHSKRQVARLELERSFQFLTQGNNSGALLPLARALDVMPDDPGRESIARRRIHAIMRRGAKLSAFKRVDGIASSVQFTPDGKSVVAGFEDGRIYRWQLADDQLTEIVRTPTRLQYASLSEDGSRVVAAIEVAGGKGLAQVFELESGRKLVEIPHDRAIDMAKFAKEDQWILTASADGVGRVWNLADIAAPAGVFDPVNGRSSLKDISLSHSGKRLVTAGADGRCRLYDVETRNVSKVIQHQEFVWNVEFSPDDRQLLTSSFDGTATIHDLDSWERQVLQHPLEVESARFSPDGTLVVTAGMDYAVRVWSSETGQEVLPPMWHEGYLHDVEFDSSGDRVVTCTSEGQLRVWDLRTATEKPEPTKGFYLEDGWHLASFEGRDFKVTHAKTGEVVFERSLKEDPRGEVGNVLANQDLTRFVIVGADFGDGVIDPKFSIILGPDHERPLFSVIDAVIDSKRERLIIHKTTGQSELWSIENGERLEVFEEAPLGRESAMDPDSPQRNFAFNPAKTNQMATFAGDRLWLVDLGSKDFRELKFRNPAAGTELGTLQFSPDGTLLLASRSNQRMESLDAQLWDTESGELQGVLEHNDGVLKATFSPDGGMIATSSEDKTVGLWKKDASGRWLRSQSLRHSTVAGFANFNADGSLVTTVSMENPFRVRVWDTETGDVVMPDVEAPWWALTEASLVEGDQTLYVRRLLGTTVKVPAGPTLLSQAELQSYAEMLHGHKLDESGTFLPLSPDEMQAAWKKSKHIAATPDSNE